MEELSTPKLSIIVPIYNVEDFLRECLDSLILIEHKNEYEVILVDDKGNDNSMEIALNYVEQHPDIFIP